MNEGRKIPSVASKPPGRPATRYPIKVAEVKTGPGVTCPIEIASSSCCSVIQPSRVDKICLQKRQQHIAAAVKHCADLQECKKERSQADWNWQRSSIAVRGRSGSSGIKASIRLFAAGGLNGKINQRPAEQKRSADARWKNTVQNQPVRALPAFCS